MSSLDKEAIEEAQLAVALARRALYKLNSAVSRLTHDEKRTALQKLIMDPDDMYSRMDKIDFQLKR